MVRCTTPRYRGKCMRLCSSKSSHLLPSLLLQRSNVLVTIGRWTVPTRPQSRFPFKQCIEKQVIGRQGRWFRIVSSIGNEFAAQYRIGLIHDLFDLLPPINDRSLRCRFFQDLIQCRLIGPGAPPFFLDRCSIFLTRDGRGGSPINGCGGIYLSQGVQDVMNALSIFLCKAWANGRSIVASGADVPKSTVDPEYVMPVFGDSIQNLGSEEVVDAIHCGIVFPTVRILTKTAIPTWAFHSKNTKVRNGQGWWHVVALVAFFFLVVLADIYRVFPPICLD
mmetsp:Transcript_24567/g.60235  ORF Transcript_24567/g.60235 Transcript_24567/m.60235 type:complete len:278 (+) Transcript_24567:337-1170(+)